MKKGSKVICINSRFEAWVLDYYIALPVEGNTYIVRDIIDGATASGAPEFAVYLEGLHNPASNKAPHFERGFSITRFREIDELREELREKVSKGLQHAGAI